MKNETTEVWDYVLRFAKVGALLLLAALAIWRANSYIDPRSLLPQVFLCVTALMLGLTAFSIGLGFVEAETD